uniref:Uncharacterized protein n=1 Tax=Pithovirus LCPAC304 TaxID=2506594 RepID=A0A481Z985_9VIRU|nr:MAG: hypothetical protein LCPAC304_00160 [Pithovirus LCPAC304]
MDVVEVKQLLKDGLSPNTKIIDMIGAMKNDDNVLEGLRDVFSGSFPGLTSEIVKEMLQAFDMDAFCQRILNDALTEEEESALLTSFSLTMHYVASLGPDCDLLTRIVQIAERIERES